MPRLYKTVLAIISKPLWYLAVLMRLTFQPGMYRYRSRATERIVAVGLDVCSVLGLGVGVHEGQCLDTGMVSTIAGLFGVAVPQRPHMQ